MDVSFWEKLAGLDPDSVCRRSNASYDAGGYRFCVLGCPYTVDPRRHEVRCSSGDNAEDGQAVSGALELLIVHYLLNARDMPLSGTWLGLQEFGGVNRFFVSHEPNFERLMPLFAEASDAVVRAARSLGGGPLDFGDLAVKLQVLPRVPIAFVYWEASEEFTASASVLLDSTAEHHLPLDVMSATVQQAISTLVDVASFEKGR